MTLPKISFEVVNSGTVSDIDPVESVVALVEEIIAFGGGKNKIYFPTVSILGVTGSGLAQVTAEMLYRANNTDTDFDVYIRITNELLSNLVEIPFQANGRSVRYSRHLVDLAAL